MQKWLAISGMVSVIWWWIVVIVLAAMWPGYSHISQWMSELGGYGSPVALLFNVLGFIVTGLLMIAFGYGVYRGSDAKVGSFLFVLMGVVVFMEGFFPWPGTPFTEMIHDSIFIIGAIAVNIAMFAFSRSFKRDERWRSIWGYTLFSGIITLILFMVINFQYYASAWLEFAGLTQRIWMLILMQWIFVMAFTLFRLSES